MTQTDLDWMKDVLKALDQRHKLPSYPLARGPRNPNLVLDFRPRDQCSHERIKGCSACGEGRIDQGEN